MTTGSAARADVAMSGVRLVDGGGGVVTRRLSGGATARGRGGGAATASTVSAAAGVRVVETNSIGSRAGDAGISTGASDLDGAREIDRSGHWRGHTNIAPVTRIPTATIPAPASRRGRTRTVG